MVAADSWRPIRSKSVARMAKGLRNRAVFPESWELHSGWHSADGHSLVPSNQTCRTHVASLTPHPTKDPIESVGS